MATRDNGAAAVLVAGDWVGLLAESSAAAQPPTSVARPAATTNPMRLITVTFPS